MEDNNILNCHSTKVFYFKKNFFIKKLEKNRFGVRQCAFSNFSGIIARRILPSPSSLAFQIPRMRV
jgi:hypothetical protein